MVELKLVGGDEEGPRRPYRREANGPWLEGPKNSLEDFVRTIAENLSDPDDMTCRNNVHAALSGIIHKFGKDAAYRVMDRMGLRHFNFKRYGFDEP